MGSKIDTFGEVDIHILTIFGVKKVVFWAFFQLVLELFRKCLGIVTVFHKISIEIS